MKREMKLIFIIFVLLISCTKVTSPPYISPPLALDAIIYFNNDIEFEWTDTSDNEDGFKIDRKIEGSEWEIARGTTSENVESWIDSFSWEVKQYYRVYAFKGEHSSEYSNIYEIGGD
ncbi:MAG: hypothetical protein KAS53_12600 [Candidatus Cloacimonetes bacterium]|nr:hypothetical protein [Candidatus Cloacimonadota bacterium]